MNQLSAKEIKQKYEVIKHKIQESAVKTGRSSLPVKLIVVTKKQPVQVIQKAIEAGIQNFGENYADEAEVKIQQIGNVAGITWHMIGHVQSRKAEIAAKYFGFVHSVDSIKLATRLDKFALMMNKTLPVLLECNVSGEVNKYGFMAASDETLLQLVLDAERISQLPNLKIRGLMTMPPLFDDPEQTRPFFRRMRYVQQYLTKRISHVDWAELSMGTSGDFHVAVEEGATIVRIGTAILGPRGQTSFL